MEKPSFVLRLPPGFRFHPTDEELVVQYLKRKVLSYPLPASIIREADVRSFDPWDLPGDSQQERYFFCTRQAQYPSAGRSDRVSGYWKAIGSDKKIVGSQSQQLVGMKKTLAFYRGRRGCRTDWIMHEYRLVTKENWVLCRVFLKRRNIKKGSRAKESRSSSCSSVITDDEEESSGSTSRMNETEE